MAVKKYKVIFWMTDACEVEVEAETQEEAEKWVMEGYWHEDDIFRKDCVDMGIAEVFEIE